MKIDFRSFARDIAQRNELDALEPVIEKELIHYEILQSLSKYGLLSHLTFQGGTCLRLCYGSQRYSEDLDFTAGDEFDELDLPAFSKTLQSDLLKAYDVTVRVREPKMVREFDGVGMRRWTVIVDTATSRPDLPSQRIKLEVASVPSYTSEVRQVESNYRGLPASYGQTLARCQSAEEILADKLVSFANTEGYIRHRDLWDIPWIAKRAGFDETIIAELVERKHEDYNCNLALPALLALGQERAAMVIETSRFRDQMRRFLPPETYDRTIANEDWRKIMLEQICGMYQKVAKDLELDEAMERERADARTIAAADMAKHDASRTMRGKTI